MSFNLPQFKTDRRQWTGKLVSQQFFKDSPPCKRVVATKKCSILDVLVVRSERFINICCSQDRLTFSCFYGHQKMWGWEHLIYCSPNSKKCVCGGGGGHLIYCSPTLKSVCVGGGGHLIYCSPTLKSVCVWGGTFDILFPHSKKCVCGGGDI